LLIALAALGLTAAACGDDDDDASTTTTEAAAESSTTTTAADDGASLVELVDADLGQILASDGRTLYTFAPDDGGASTCYGDCATNWPPLLADSGVTAGDGLDAGLFGTVARDDGGEQVTVDGWPLYFFSGDAAAGDVNGQGVGDVWYVVGPDGTAIDDD
jgi:predicted lipoprotein with Yx(FWY)xxD motif